MPGWPMKLRGHRREIVLGLALFCLALVLRLGYQQVSEIEHPIQKDARQYFAAAYNVVFHGVYATTLADNDNQKPPPDVGRPPGYPLFLMPFMATSPTAEAFLKRTTTAQAILGALTTLLVFLTGRLFMGLWGAGAAGGLTALSPHLVALDHFVLSESLFVFTLALGIYMVSLSLKRRSMGLPLAAGAVLGFAVLVRPIALFLGPWLAPVLIARKKGKPRSGLRLGVAQLLCILVGWSAVYTPYLAWRNHVTSGGSFTISDQSILHRVIGGMDVDMEHFIRAKTDPELKRKRAAMAENPRLILEHLRERMVEAPFETLGWYLGGKILFMWRWNNLYHGGPGGIGDVYHYPMVKRGFHENALLKAVHGFMKILHWPLYVLTLLSPIFLVGRLRRDEKVRLALPSLLAFLYVAAVLTVLAPMPRYAIPVRPFAYLLAMVSLSEVARMVFHPKRREVRPVESEPHLSLGRGES